MAAVLTPRQTDVADDDDQAAAWNEHPQYLTPDPSQLGHELVVVADVAKLAVAADVLLERPVRRGRNDQVQRLGSILEGHAALTIGSVTVGPHA